MTDPNYTALLLIVDRSGSMSSIKSDMEGGLKTLLEEQIAQPGLLTVDLFTFDNEVTHEFAMTDPSILDIKIEPRGATALYDAIGIGVNEFGRSLATMPEHARPATVQVIVVTDGEENSSLEYKSQAIKKLVTKQKEQYSWDFVFLGANQDAVMSGEQLGFDPGSSMTFEAGSVGVDASAKGVSRYMSDVRKKQKKSFLLEERNSSLNANPSQTRNKESKDLDPHSKEDNS